MLVLDTDALSIIQRGAGSQFDALAKMLDESGDDVYVTIISADEPIHGAFNEIASNEARLRVRGYRRLRTLLNDFAGRPILDYDDKVESIFGRLKGLKGRPATKDLRIASIVLSHDATLVTGNINDFKVIPMLKVKLVPR